MEKTRIWGYPRFPSIMNDTGKCQLSPPPPQLENRFRATGIHATGIGLLMSHSNDTFGSLAIPGVCLVYWGTLWSQRSVRPHSSLPLSRLSLLRSQPPLPPLPPLPRLPPLPPLPPAACLGTAVSCGLTPGCRCVLWSDTRLSVCPVV